jgi:hypothetical protein
VIYASKHQSMFETVEYLVILDHPAVVLKRELADLPAGAEPLGFMASFPWTAPAAPPRSAGCWPPRARQSTKAGRS